MLSFNRTDSIERWLSDTNENNSFYDKPKHSPFLEPIADEVEIDIHSTDAGQILYGLYGYGLYELQNAMLDSSPLVQSKGSPKAMTPLIEPAELEGETTWPIQRSSQPHLITRMRRKFSVTRDLDSGI
jgi:hypothetical protein